MITTAIFDLDNTLLGNDSDYLWGRFLLEIGAVGPKHEHQNERYLIDYEAGTLDIDEYLKFSLAPLADSKHDLLCEWRRQFFETHIRTHILPKAINLVESHRLLGHRLLVATATNSFITRPIVDFFGIDTLIATEPETLNGSFTGNVSGLPCLGVGKLNKVQAWLDLQGIDSQSCAFYSDSRNDIPLLEQVGRPVATDPDKVLDAYARQRQWAIITLR